MMFEQPSGMFGFVGFFLASGLLIGFFTWLFYPKRPYCRSISHEN